MRRRRVMFAVAALVVAIAAAVIWRSLFRPEPEPPAPAMAPPATQPEVARAPEVPASPPSPPVPQTIETPPATQQLAAKDVDSALMDLLGRKAVLSFLQTESFPRRFVATVDNLGRPNAPPMVWPVNPTPGRFQVEERADGTLIAVDNSQRYTPFVLLAESVDVERTVDLYVRMYPLLQQAYEELGYPNRYFNDRLLQVIDQLLATPEATYPLKVELTEVKGPIPSVRPWVRYQFTDPALESLSAGQKILLRTGPVNERRLKARLRQLRAEVLKRVTR